MKIVEIPVDMVAYFESCLPPKPIRFRYHRKEDDKEVVVKIEKVRSQYYTSYFGKPTYIYEVQGKTEDDVRICELMYNVTSAQWQISKM